MESSSYGRIVDYGNEFGIGKTKAKNIELYDSLEEWFKNEIVMKSDDYCVDYVCFACTSNNSRCYIKFWAYKKDNKSK